MSVSDDILHPSSDSFWEVDCYKRTVKRHDDGFKLCDDLKLLIRERAELENMYAQKLRDWSSKWNRHIEKGPEYGTMEAACKSVLEEADRVADIHQEVKEKLIDDVNSAIKQWRSEHFHKSMMGSCKEAKELEEGFKKAQKPWSKKLSKVQKAKKEYHTACKLEKTATHQESNARGDSGTSPDQLKKLQDRAEKCRKDVIAAKERYEAALSDIESYNARYMEDMTEVFNKSQEYEEKRLQFFKEMLYGIHKCLDISAKAEFPQIYSQLHQAIGIADHSKDLKWWSQNHGVDMAMNWPAFEEYSPNMHTISKKEKKGGITSGDGITLTAINRSETASQNTYATLSNNQPQQQQQPPSEPASNGGQANPFGEEWADEYENPPLLDDGSEGTPVRALFDYVGQEADELSFKIGDVFVMLEGRDDQGWCKGRKDGKVGLYPDNYVEAI